MIKPYRVLFTVLILSLALSGVSWGQPAPGAAKGGGPGGLYDPKTVVTVSGIVVSKTTPAMQQGLPKLIYLTLQTQEGRISVFLGPDVFIDQMPLKIDKLDRIQVTGSKIMMKGQPVIVAAQIKKGEDILRLRDANGVPAWGGRDRK